MKEYKNFYAVREKIKEIETLIIKVENFNKFKNSIININDINNTISYGLNILKLDNYKIFNQKLNNLMVCYYNDLLKELETKLLVFEMFNEG